MKWTRFASLIILTLVLSAGAAMASSDDTTRQSSDVNKMLHKAGPGVVNVLTCWVEWPRNVANEWDKTDPVTGIALGTIKGFGGDSPVSPRESMTLPPSRSRCPRITRRCSSRNSSSPTCGARRFPS